MAAAENPSPARTEPDAPGAPVVTGVHLVGSVNSPDAATTFRLVADHVGPLATRIPDGEVGDRFYWIQFQNELFDGVEGLERVGEPGPRIRDRFDLRKLRIAEGTRAADIVLPPLGYADAALDSWEAFRTMRDAGTIMPGTRFQVSLPSPVGVVGAFVRDEDRAAFEPVYERALLGELERIVAGVPAEDLAVQWDCAVEFAILERARVGAWGTQPWWDGESDLDGVVERLQRLGGAVPSGVALGYHLCYGDVEEAHFVQPEDTGVLASVLRGVLAGPRHVDFVHLPVPIERADAGYFAPLAAVDTGDTELVLGLVHHEDGLAGALARVEAARTAVPRFGIATECGFGRGPAERTAPLLDLHRQVVEAVDAAR